MHPAEKSHSRESFHMHDIGLANAKAKKGLSCNHSFPHCPSTYKWNYNLRPNRPHGWPHKSIIIHKQIRGVRESG